MITLETTKTDTGRMQRLRGIVPLLMFLLAATAVAGEDWKATDTLTLGFGYLRQEDRGEDGDRRGFNGLQTVVSVVL